VHELRQDVTDERSSVAPDTLAPVASEVQHECVRGDGDPDRRRIVVVRHAKSSRNEPALQDKDRPLNARGERDAAKMGERLAKIGVKPDLILSSPARRALTTAEIVANKLDYNPKNILVDDRLYGVDADDLLDVIRKLGDKSKRVMLFGHNPELTELGHRLSSETSHAKETDLPGASGRGRTRGLHVGSPRSPARGEIT